ncbi:MAG TPA: hypothetical protein VIJ20_02530 [Solirubrobacteraceae bacterium]
MIGTIIIIAIVLVVIAGFWLTRGAGGPGPLDAEARRVDTEARVSPMGEPMSFDDEFKPPRD